jgi:hypothetical protein
MKPTNFSDWRDEYIACRWLHLERMQPNALGGTMKKVWVAMVAALGLALFSGRALAMCATDAEADAVRKQLGDAYSAGWPSPLTAQQVARCNNEIMERSYHDCRHVNWATDPEYVCGLLIGIGPVSNPEAGGAVKQGEHLAVTQQKSTVPASAPDGTKYYGNSLQLAKQCLEYWYWGYDNSLHGHVWRYRDKCGNVSFDVKGQCPRSHEFDTNMAPSRQFDHGLATCDNPGELRVWVVGARPY